MSEPRRPAGIPAQYERFRGERARPFFDLVGRLPDGRVRRVADLGCGTGELTRTLLERWPEADVVGIDYSQEMLARASAGSTQPRLRFVRADLASWEPEAPLDRIVSNAALQWLPEHGVLLERLTRFLAPEGALAVQVPHNRGEGAFRALDELCLEAPWRERFQHAERRPSIGRRSSTPSGCSGSGSRSSYGRPSTTTGWPARPRSSSG